VYVKAECLTADGLRGYKWLALGSGVDTLRVDSVGSARCWVWQWWY